MKNYYCHKCSMHLGYLNTLGIEHINFTGSTYLLEKFIKHTIPPTTTGLTSIYSDSSYDNYKDSIVNSLHSGSTIVAGGQIDVVWFSNQDNGVKYIDGVIQGTTNVVKTVLHHNSDRIHSFPIHSSELITKNCDSCGSNILTGSTSHT